MSLTCVLCDGTQLKGFIGPRDNLQLFRVGGTRVAWVALNSLDELVRHLGDLVFLSFVLVHFFGVGITAFRALEYYECDACFDAAGNTLPSCAVRASCAPHRTTRSHRGHTVCQLSALPNYSQPCRTCGRAALAALAALAAPAGKNCAGGLHGGRDAAAPVCEMVVRRRALLLCRARLNRWLWRQPRAELRLVTHLHHLLCDERAGAPHQKPFTARRAHSFK
eukprot:5722439-Prymnesium_polylepis.1